MKIHSLSLRHFRNHADRAVEWGPRFNLITGPNGAGKTNLLDAIHVACMSRSFVTSTDRLLASHAESWFSIEGAFSSAARPFFSLRCFYSHQEGKTFFVNDSPLDRLSDLIGLVPVVVMSPEDRRLTGDGPSERRSFLDGFISQLSKAYLQDLIRYRRVLRQRNTLLQQGGLQGRALRAALEPWNVQLAQTGGRIIVRRAEVLNRFEGYLSEHFQALTRLKLQPHLTYRTVCEIPAVAVPPAPAPAVPPVPSLAVPPAPASATDPSATSAMESLLESTLMVALDEAFDRESERRQTLVGPHRDEILFHLDDIELRKYGSQGQHRLFAMALKLAESFYLRDELDDQPILLLDDVFGHLDQEKTETMLNILDGMRGQVFITSANHLPFEEMRVLDGDGSIRFAMDSEELRIMDV